ncbi:hypothetical protein OUZ56_033283 [Daphnia magna]|uniref:Uncharacterized protein n=1 Tax=Daphnia magna TaxID=35525 RepID=A0ABR0BAI9_9CRUS|nr:hypothetical protein OUZ56_033283 [Daphnia magna]
MNQDHEYYYQVQLLLIVTETKYELLAKVFTDPVWIASSVASCAMETADGSLLSMKKDLRIGHTTRQGRCRASTSRNSRFGPNPTYPIKE